jgi:hypothetical protein
MSTNDLPIRYVEFDRLPDSAYVDVRVVALLHDCAPITVGRRVTRGEIPAPHKIGAHRRWLVSDLRNARKF